MVLNFKNLFNGSVEKVSIDYNINLPEFLYGTYNPLTKGVNVCGKAYSKADVVYIDAKVSFEFNGFCDRCAEPVSKQMSFDINKIIVEHLANEDDFDDYIVVENDSLNLDSLIEEEIILFLPSKMLCKDDCKGLCYKCGKNLNQGKCDCAPDVDPRMSALLSLLDEKENNI